LQSKNDYQTNYTSVYPSEIEEDDNRVNKAIKVIKILKSQISLEGARVLEIGCFTGRFADVFSTEVKELIAIDIDPNAVRLATERNTAKNVMYEVQNCEDLPYKESLFDIVICNHIYEHTPNPLQMLLEIKRVLKSGGVCYFAAGNRFQIMEPHHRILFLSWWPKSIANYILRVRYFRNTNYHENHLSYKQLLDLFSDFEITDFTLKLLSSPEEYGFEDELRPGGIKQFAAIKFHKYFKRFFPTFIFLLKKI
jgi:2-polyprenyl-3-methyl-5-hydroxy-6-metoxy-1,4-benzoquinol methylase